MADTAAQLESVARHLELAAAELLPDLRAAISRPVTAVQGEIRAGLVPRLPNPYAAVLNADLTLRVSQRTSDRDPGVTLTGTTRSGRRRLRRLDAGILAHPLYGNRNHWYDQPVVPGWFTGPAGAAKPRVRAEIEQALADAADKATRKGL